MSFIEVTHEKFHATVGKMNVHPRAEKEASYWETPYRDLMDITTPGYLCEGRKAWFIRSDLNK